MDLIGIPHRLVLGDKGLAKGVAEYKGRRDKQVREIALDNIAGKLREIIKSEASRQRIPTRWLPRRHWISRAHDIPEPFSCRNATTCRNLDSP